MAADAPPNLVPDWLDAREIDQIIQPPPSSEALRLVVQSTANAARLGGARCIGKFLRSGNQLAKISAGVAATTEEIDGHYLTVVVFHHGGGQLRYHPLPALLGLVRAYGNKFTDTKWRQTRWFVATPEEGLQEIKVFSRGYKQTWFAQLFALPEAA